MSKLLQFSDPLAEIPRIGPIYEKRLKKLGIATVRDLLFYFPRDYEDLSRIVSIANAKEGNQACIAGTILQIQERRTFRKRLSITEGLVQDATGAIKTLWFNQPYLSQTLAKGDAVVLAGKVVRDKEGVYLANPTYEKIRNSQFRIPNYELTHVGRIVPIYPEAAGISSRWLRSVIKMALAQLEKPEEILPEKILREKKFPLVKTALWQIHFPDSLDLAKAAKERFSFEELFSILLFILSERKKIASVKAPPISFDAALMKRFTNSLPFALTDAQKKSAWHILKDMEKPRPMNRLLEGDVGSGKTVVGAMAALSVAKHNFQTAWMAPTEILAQQHFKTVGQLLAPFKITAALLTGKTDRFISPKLPNDFIEVSREKLLNMAKENKVHIVIGTHALIQEKVHFGNLGLVIVDEQHRFGVRQRAALSAPAKASAERRTLIPHFLSMTATPIPRTLAMTIYGDLDLSVIDEMPAGRKKTITQIVPPSKRTESYKFIEQQVKNGRQVFVICPRIEPSEAADMKAVKEEYEKLSKEVFPHLAVAMLHGNMAAREKEEAMKKFKRGKTDILVSTSVVEVGVDIPNAAVMMIEGADRFGLAQLHQFRGRVGRGKEQSYCLLFTETNSAKSLKRLRAVEQLENGFELAEMDLKLRGPGDFVGKKQWGMPDFAMEQIANAKLVEEARETAKGILEEDIALGKYPALKQKVQELRQKLHLE